MDADLIRLIKEKTPKINEDLACGLATIHLKYAEEYIDNVLRSASNSFPAGFVYEGYRRCTPYEDYEYNIRKKGRALNGNKTIQKSAQFRYDIASYDYYMVEYLFSFNGEKLKPVPISMPYVTEGGAINIKGTKWYISPVLADRVISVGDKNIFVRLQRDKLIFNREPYRYKCNGERRDFSLVYSSIYHISKNNSGPKMYPKGKTTMVHYLFCKHGVTKAFQLYGGCTPIIGDDLDTKLDTNEYAIFSTLGIPPSSRGRSKAYSGEMPTIQIAVKHSEVNNYVNALVTGLFYIADLFPKLIVSEHVDNPTTWIAPMGFLLFPLKMNRGKMQESVLNHCESLDDYADIIVIEQMRKIGYNIEDIYRFFAIIAANFDDILLDGIPKINSMYDKEMSVLYFVFLDFIYSIFNMLFGLKAASKKGMTIKDIENVIKQTMKQTLMYNIQVNHGEIQNINYSGDNMALKPTSTLVPQTNTNKATSNKGSDRSISHDPTKQIHVSVAEIGSVSAITKADPTGRSIMNHYMRLSDDKTLVLRNPEIEELLDTVQEMINRR